MQDDLHEGALVTLAQEVDLQPLCTLPAGARGVVTEVMRDRDGFIFAVEITMNRIHRGLEPWCNRALLGREDVLDAVELVPDASPTALSEAA